MYFKSIVRSVLCKWVYVVSQSVPPPPRRESAFPIRSLAGAVVKTEAEETHAHFSHELLSAQTVGFGRLIVAVVLLARR